MADIKSNVTGKDVENNSTLNNSQTEPPSTDEEEIGFEEFDSELEMGYIKGYERASTRYLYPGPPDGAVVVFDQSQDKPTHNYDNDKIRTQTMPTMDEDTFKYAVEISNNDFEFEDPTYLGYDVKIDMDSSPLFNYGKGVNNPELNSALDFIKKYGIIEEIGKRETIWKEFVNQILKIFDTDLNSDKMEGKKNKSYYIESITGLDKLTNKMVEKYEEDKLTFTLVEDISLRSTYIAELYNNLIYSYKNQRYLIPFNCLRFDLIIRISDIRTFKIPKGDGYYANNTTPAYTLYKLHDCNFDFTNSKPHTDSLSVGGFGKADSEPKPVTFDITYKSVSREFRSPLINNSLAIANKNTAILSYGQYIGNDPNAKTPSSKSEEVVKKEEDARKGTSNGVKTNINSTVDDALGFLKSGNIKGAMGAIGNAGGDLLGGGLLGAAAGAAIGSIGNLGGLGGLVNNFSTGSESKNGIFGNVVDNLKRSNLITDTLYKVKNQLSEKTGNIPIVGSKASKFINEIDTTKATNFINENVTNDSTKTSGVLKNLDIGALLNKSNTTSDISGGREIIGNNNNEEDNS